MDTQMIIRLDEKLKKSMYRLARTEGKTASQVVRELVAQYVTEHNLGAYIDDLWQRTGRKLKKAGKGIKDIDKAIRDVRKTRL